MKCILIPGKSMGLVHLNSGRDDIRRLLDGPFTAFKAEKKELLDEVETPDSDYFEKSSIKVEYDADEKAIFIEAGSLISLYYDSHSLFDMSFQEVYRLFKTLDPGIVLDDIGFASEKLGIAVYAPTYEDEPGQPAELISIFVEGYYSTNKK